MARPTKVTSSVQEKICYDLADGKLLQDLCKEVGVDRSNVYRATQSNKAFGANYDRARTFAADARLDDAVSMLRHAVTRDDILRAKELVHSAQWYAEKTSRQYQPTAKSEVTHSGPMVIGWQKEPQDEKQVIVDDDEPQSAEMIN